MKRKLALLLVFVLMVGILGGCSKKAPEGVSQAFYDDMLECIKKVNKPEGANGYKHIVKYKKVEDTLSEREQKILKSMSSIYMYVSLNDGASNTFDDKAKEQLEVFARLMDIDIKVDKIIAN